MSGEHAPLPPSFAPVWGHCSAAPIMLARYPKAETDTSREGTAAHWAIAQVLQYDPDLLRAATADCAVYLGAVAPNGVIVDGKMVEGAQIMIDDVQRVIDKHLASGDHIRMYVEHRVSMAPIHPDNWGTLDCAVVVRAGGEHGRIIVIYLWDYKHGHREVRAKDNLQLVDYMQGLRYELGIDGVQDQEINIVFRIVQPFCYSNRGPVDGWYGKLADLRAHVNVLHMKAAESRANPRATSGVHCRDCPGVLSCSTSRRHVYGVIDYVDEPFEMDEMSGADLAVERGILENGMKLLKARLDAVNENLTHRISGGESGTGLALESSYGRLEWTIPVPQAVALASQFGFDISTQDVKTPTQALQAAPKHVKAAFELVLKSVTKRPARGLTLVNADDTIGARAFKQKEQ